MSMFGTNNQLNSGKYLSAEVEYLKIVNENLRQQLAQQQALNDICLTYQKLTLENARLKAQLGLGGFNG